MTPVSGPSLSTPSSGRHVLHSVYDAGGVLRVAEDIAYTDGDQAFTATYTVTDESSTAQDFRALEAADLYAGGSDSGTGFFAAGPPRVVGGRSSTDPSVVGALVEGTPWSHYEENDFGTVFGDGEDSTTDLKDTIDPGSVDNGVGVDWDATGLAPSATRTFTVQWTFSPTAGTTPPGGGTTSPPPPAGGGSQQAPPPSGGGATTTPTGSSASSSGPPPPVFGHSVDVAPVSGRVLVRISGSRRFVELRAGERIPLGSLVDATSGVVAVTAQHGRGGPDQTADFSAGQFLLGQVGGRNPVALLTLAGPLPQCGPAARGAVARAARRRRVRSLWGDGHGSFRTRGRYSAATVRGTKWLTQDECDGTLTRVARGVVAVSDFTRHRTVLVPAGRSYLARPPRGRGRR